MAVHLSEIALAGLLKIAKDEGREDLHLALANAIQLHLSHGAPDERSNELRGLSEQHQTPVYLYPISKWRVLWALDGEDVVVWSVTELSGSRANRQDP